MPAGPTSRCPHPDRSTSESKVWFVVSVALTAYAIHNMGLVAGIATAFVAIIFRPFPHLNRPLIPDAGKSYKTVDFQKEASDCPRTGAKYLVVGTGFLGKRIVDRLMERGETNVRLFDLVPCAAYVGDSRVEMITGSVCNKEDLVKACSGVECVYSTFACIQFFARLPHQEPVSVAVNVDGTKNLMEACVQTGVKRVIYTSSSNAMIAPGLERFNMDEHSQLVPKSMSHNHYSWTKAAGEKIVNEYSNKLETVIIRPCTVVFGPGDVRILQRVLSPVCGLRFAPLVYNHTFVDYVFVDNVVLGELKAEARLREKATGVSGGTFNISNDAPLCFEEFWTLCRRHIKGLISCPVPKHVLWITAYLAEAVLSISKGKFRLPGIPGDLAPAALITTGLSYNVDCTKARTMLNWRPIFTVDQGIELTVAESAPEVLKNPEKRGGSTGRD